MRHRWSFPLEDLLLGQLFPGLVLLVGWTVMYEIYHEDGSYYTTLLQEILATEGLFPYFLALAVLLAVPVGLVADTARQVMGESWLRIPRPPAGIGPFSPLAWMRTGVPVPEGFERRYLLYRHAWATLLAPARAAGNLALVLLVLLVWFVVKVFRMGGWQLFSPAFILGTPLVGLAIVAALLTRYVTGLSEFRRLLEETLFPPGGDGHPAPADATPSVLP